MMKPPDTTGPGPAPALAFSGVRKAYPGHLGLRRATVLHGISLSVERGTIHGLLGPNGAGKTTAIRIALDLLRPDEGGVEIFGLPSGDTDARRRVGFLPENPTFYDYLTGREFLDLSARLAGVPKAARGAEVSRLLEAVGMSARAGTPLRRCSKGMVQRVGMAQALIGGPDLLILDEPMSGLDPVGRREFRDLILQQRREGRTVLFSSHILQDAEMICDRVSILDGGRVVAEGELGALLGREVKFWEVTVFGLPPERLNGNWERVSETPAGVLVRVPREEDLDRLVRSVCDGGGRVRSVVPCRETLEDLFLRQIGREWRP